MLAPLPSPCSPPASSTRGGSRGEDGEGGSHSLQPQLVAESCAQILLQVEGHVAWWLLLAEGPAQRSRTQDGRDGGGTTPECCHRQQEAPAAPWDFLSIAARQRELGTGTAPKLLGDSLQVGPTGSPLTALQSPRQRSDPAPAPQKRPFRDHRTQLVPNCCPTTCSGPPVPPQLSSISHHSYPHPREGSDPAASPPMLPSACPRSASPPLHVPSGPLHLSHVPPGPLHSPHLGAHPPPLPSTHLDPLCTHFSITFHALFSLPT